jgi:protein TonB
MTTRRRPARRSLPVLLAAALAAGGAARAGEALLGEWERVKAADDPVGYVRFLEAHPDFVMLAELRERMAEANRRAAAAGAQVEIPLATLEPVGPNVYLGEAVGPGGAVPVIFSFAFEGELSVGTGGAAKRNFGSRDPARLVPGAEGEEGKGSWASLSGVADSLAAGWGRDEPRPIVAIVWGPGGFLPPAEIYVGGRPVLHFVRKGAEPPPLIGEEIMLPEPARADTSLGLAFDEPPVPIRISTPDYPEEARQAKVEGVVLVLVTVGETGRVLEAQVLKSGTIASLEAAAVRAALLSVFRPATRQGGPVKARVVLPFHFKLH